MNNIFAFGCCIAMTLFVANTMSNSLTQKVYGYDFDGVLHVSVTKPSTNGQRHALLSGVIVPFNEMIKKIKTELSSGNEIYIITAWREPQDYMRSLLKGNGLSELTDRIVCTNGENKVKYIRDLKVNEFYDDSANVLNIIKEAKMKGLLPDLQKLFHVIPESRSWKEISLEPK